MKNIQTPIKEGEQSIGNAVFDGYIGIGEINEAIKNALIKKPIVEILSLENEKLGRITKIIKGVHTKQESERSNAVQGLINETAELRRNFDGVPKIQEQNGIDYLVVDKENLYEVREQIGDTIIGYNLISKKYIMYNLKENKEIYLGDNPIIKAAVDGYYTFEGRNSTIVHVNPNGDIKNLGNYRINGQIKKHGESIFVELNDWEMIIIESSGEIKKFTCYAVFKAKSKSGKNLLIIASTNTRKFTIYDIDYKKTIVSDVEIKDYDKSFEDGIYNLPDTIKVKKSLIGFWKDLDI